MQTEHHAGAVLDPGVRSRRRSNYGSLILQFALKDFKIRYTHSVLGYTWSVINPVISRAGVTSKAKFLADTASAVIRTEPMAPPGNRPCRRHCADFCRRVRERASGGSRRRCVAPVR